MEIEIMDKTYKLKEFNIAIYRTIVLIGVSNESENYGYQMEQQINLLHLATDMPIKNILLIHPKLFFETFSVLLNFYDINDITFDEPEPKKTNPFKIVKK